MFFLFSFFDKPFQFQLCAPGVSLRHFDPAYYLLVPLCQIVPCIANSTLAYFIVHLTLSPLPRVQGVKPALLRGRETVSSHPKRSFVAYQYNTNLNFHSFIPFYLVNFNSFLINLTRSLCVAWFGAVWSIYPL